MGPLEITLQQAQARYLQDPRPVYGEGGILFGAYVVEQGFLIVDHWNVWEADKNELVAAGYEYDL